MNRPPAKGLPENIVAGVSKAAFENPQIREIISTLVSSKKEII